jgi:tetratricopeptide (TPR) repeat protein
MLPPMNTLLPVALAFLAAATPSQQARLQTPAASPAASVSHTIGTTAVVIDYHRPGVKGRKIWGELVPFGEVWRAGANEATTIRFDDPVKVDGKDVPAGTYAFFALPTKDKWTLILNKTAKQWGAYAYDAKEDQLRFDVQPKAVEATEWLTYTIDPAGAESATVHLRWEKLDVAFTVAVDVKGLVLARMDKAVTDAKPDDWRTLYQVASYYNEIDHDLPRALEMADEANRIAESFSTLELKARLLQKLKKKDQAIPALEKAIELAKGKAPQEYIDGLAKVLAEWKKG